MKCQRFREFKQTKMSALHLKNHSNTSIKENDKKTYLPDGNAIAIFHLLGSSNC